jgi:molybdenum cofactor cytidylyltransferase
MDKRPTAGIILAAGISTSLQCGLKQIQDEFPSIMVLMGDQSLLRHKIINFILMAFRSSGKDICAPVYNRKRGLPVCFTKRFYNDIFAVKGDTGAREVIRNNPEDIISLEIEDPESFLDIDDRNDFEKIQLLIKSRS